MAPRLTSGKMLNMDLASMLQGLEKADFTSQELVEYYLDRIEKLNPEYNPVAFTNPDALAIAKKCDEDRAEGKQLGPLHGIPIMVKETFITTDKMETTAGNWSLHGARWDHEATVISHLRKAGAVLLGKNTLGEWGNMWNSTMPSGWSARWGTARGAFYPNMHCAGSSTGCGVGASLGVAAAFIGGETDGSITSPSRRAGIVGLKPTPGLASRYGVVPLSESQDTVGPMVRWVKDAALVLQSIAGKDERDPLSATIPFDTPPDYLAACGTARLKGMRIGIIDAMWEALERKNDTTTRDVTRASIDLMESLGATIVRGLKWASFVPWESWEGDDLPFDADVRTTLEKFFAAIPHNPNNIRTIQDVVDFAYAHPDKQCVDKFPPDVFERVVRIDTETPEFKAQLAEQADWVRESLEMFDHCDVVMLARFSTPFANAKLPMIAVPMTRYGDSEPITKDRKMVDRGPNVPIGLLFAGRPFDEEKILTCAYAYEQATKQILSNSEALMTKL